MPLPVQDNFPIYALSDVTGLTEWVDYIPVQLPPQVYDRKNLVSYSGDLTNAYWSALSSTIEASAEASPVGGTFEKLTVTSANGALKNANTWNLFKSGDGWYTISLYVKDGTAGGAYIEFDVDLYGDDGYYVYFYYPCLLDLSTGEFVDMSGDDAIPYYGLSADDGSTFYLEEPVDAANFRIEVSEVDTGVFRVELSIRITDDMRGNKLATSNSESLYIFPWGNGGYSDAPANGEYIYVDGVQVENGTDATEYQVVTDASDSDFLRDANKPNTFDYKDGYLVSSSVLSDVTGLTAWVDYIPVYEVTGRTKPWYVGSDGYIPYNEIGSVVAWTPASLFASGEVGAWYDPSDLDTMFQVTTGGGTTNTVPITAVEQSVYLILDKSAGATLGDELFSDAAVTFVGEATRVSPGVYHLLSTAGVQCAVVVPVGASSGKVYEVSFRISNVTTAGSGVTVSNDLASSQIIFPGVAGTYTGKIRTTGNIVFRRQAGITDFYLDNISVKEIAGNHAYQATAASRPVLRARYNLLAYSEQFDNAYWTKGNAAISSNTQVAPDGTTTGDTLTAAAGLGEHRVYSANVSGGSASHNRSVYAKAGTVSFISLANGSNTIGYAVFDLSLGEVALTNGSITATMTDVGNGWYRCESVGHAAGNGFLVVNMGDTALNARPTIAWTAAGTETVHLWGGQLEDQGSASVRPYQRIAAATDYVTSSTMETYDFPYYLEFDGVDDRLEVYSTADGAASSSNTVVLACTQENYDANPYLYGGSGDDGIEMLLSSSTGYLRPYVGRVLSSFGSIGSTDVVGPTPFIFSVTWDTSTITLRSYLNGALETEDSSVTASDKVVNTKALASRGPAGSVTLLQTGKTFHFVIIDRLLSDVERGELETYAAGKAGVTLA